MSETSDSTLKTTLAAVAVPLAGGAIAGGVATHIMGTQLIEEALDPTSDIHQPAVAEEGILTDKLSMKRYNKLMDDVHEIQAKPRYEELTKAAAAKEAGAIEPLVRKQAVRTEEALKYLGDPSSITKVSFKKLEGRNLYSAAVYPTPEALATLTKADAIKTHMMLPQYDGEKVIGGHYTIHGIHLPEGYANRPVALVRDEKDIYHLAPEKLNTIEKSWFEMARDLKITKPLKEIKEAAAVKAEISAVRKLMPAGAMLKHMPMEKIATVAISAVVGVVAGALAVRSVGNRQSQLLLARQQAGLDEQSPFAQR